jgi:hypothetical protein
MRLDISTQLGCSPAVAWNEVQTSAHLLRVTWPLVKFVPARPATFPERWSQGATIECRPYIFGFIPTGVHTFHFERIDHEKYEIQSCEYSPLIKRWDHLISIKSVGEGRSLYRDMITFDAGTLTFIVWLWASWLYRHRQRRWRAVAKSL